MKQLLILFMALMTGCGSGVLDDGYQVGDGTRAAVYTLTHLQQAINDYCSSAEGSPLRHSALMLIRVKFPEVPPDGICTFNGGQ